jgi:hypothetical protein
MSMEAIGRDPQTYRFGALVGSSLACDWMHYWFEDQQDFEAFVARARELPDGSLGSIAWRGTLDELITGDSGEALDRRRAFWEQQAENGDQDEDAVDGEETDGADDADADEKQDADFKDQEDSEHVKAIPDELLDAFVASLYPELWTGG